MFLDVPLVRKIPDLNELFSKSGQCIKDSIEEILEDKVVDTRQLIETCLDKIILLQNEVEEQKVIHQNLINAGTTAGSGPDNIDDLM